MRFLKTLLLQGTILLSILAPWSSAQALEDFEHYGLVSNITANGFNINQHKFRVSPTAKLESQSGEQIRWTDIKSGDTVWVKGTVFSNTNFVDHLMRNTQGL